MATAGPSIIVTRLTSVDWHVTDEFGFPVAWIEKSGWLFGYKVMRHVSDTPMDKRPSVYERKFENALQRVRDWMAPKKEATEDRS